MATPEPKRRGGVRGLPVLFAVILAVVILVVVVLVAVMPGEDDPTPRGGDIEEPVTEPDIEVPVEEGVPGADEDGSSDP